VVEGLDVDEVARALGRPPAAVRSLQHRALRRLAREEEPGALLA
jgi:DNA-directed RNA polymerase specialized sigma24 family protein